MAQPAKNDLEVYKMLTPQLKIVVDYIVQKIWNENRELVRLIVYEANLPSQYERTGQFKEAWDTNVESNDFTGNLEGEFFYEPDKLTANKSKGQHASFFRDEEMKEYLVDVIYDGLAGDFTGRSKGTKKYAKNNPSFAGQPWTTKRDVWSKLVKKVGKTNMDKWVAQGMRQAGLKLRKW